MFDFIWSLSLQDLFHGGELVAVKVLHKHYQMLGAQETDCVRRLNIADPEAVAPTLRLRVSSLCLKKEQLDYIVFLI